MIEELVQFALVPFKQVDSSGVVEQGADQIGAGLGPEAQELTVMGIRFKLQKIDCPCQAVAAMERIHAATFPFTSIVKPSMKM